MPVRIRPSASTEPLACDGRHATPRRSKTRFDSWQGHSTVSPRVYRTHGGLRSRKAGFDSRVGDSAAGLFSSSSGCDGRAHDPAKVEAQVRFLARTWPSGGGPKERGRRSLTAGRRSAKPQKRVRLPPAPLIDFPRYTGTTWSLMQGNRAGFVNKLPVTVVIPGRTPFCQETHHAWTRRIPPRRQR